MNSILLHKARALTFVHLYVGVAEKVVSLLVWELVIHMHVEDTYIGCGLCISNTCYY